MFKLEL